MKKAYWTYITFACIMIACCHTKLLAQSYFSYDQSVQAIYQDILTLDFDQAKEKVASLSSDSPNNLAAIHLENYIDFYQIFLFEEEALFEKLKQNKDQRIEKIADQASHDDPFKNFVIAEIELQWALARLKFEEYVKAGNEIYSAYQLLESNKKQFPDFELNNKSLSIIHSLIETIPLPEFLKKLIGIKGSINEGLEEIEWLLTASPQDLGFFYTESEAIYSYILYYQSNQKEKAFDFIEQSSIATNEDPISLFLWTKIAQGVGKNDLAIEKLENYLRSHPDHTFPFLHMLLGLSKLWTLDQNADVHFLQFLSEFQGRHYIKEAYQKLAWFELVIHQDLAQYKYYMSKCLVEGNHVIDADKQAQFEAESQSVPNHLLLQARLLYDGAYYNKAYQLLIKNAHVFYHMESAQLEYKYRLGRITQALGNHKEAIQYYLEIIQEDSYNKSYLSCNAALQTALIFELGNNQEQAKYYFTKCLERNPDKYKSSLHQKAKSGLIRLNQEH